MTCELQTSCFNPGLRGKEQITDVTWKSKVSSSLSDNNRLMNLCDLVAETKSGDQNELDGNTLSFPY